jgi:hypothetical protein
MILPQRWIARRIAEGDATIANGYLTTMSLRFQAGGIDTAATASFTNINRGSQIAAPPTANVQR